MKNFPLYLKKAGLASRNIVHLQNIILRCVGFCFSILHDMVVKVYMFDATMNKGSYSHPNVSCLTESIPPKSRASCLRLDICLYLELNKGKMMG